MATETVERRPYRQHVRAERAAATRTRILEAAAELLLARSYDEVTLALKVEISSISGTGFGGLPTFGMLMPHDSGRPARYCA